MTVENRESNVVYVDFAARAPAASCATCPFRQCCTCAHWVSETRTCLLGARDDAAPRTEAADWCGRWEAHSLELVFGEG